MNSVIVWLNDVSSVWWTQVAHSAGFGLAAGPGSLGEDLEIWLEPGYSWAGTPESQHPHPEELPLSGVELP